MANAALVLMQQISVLAAHLDSTDQPVFLVIVLGLALTELMEMENAIQMVHYDYLTAIQLAH